MLNLAMRWPSRLQCVTAKSLIFLTLKSWGFVLQIITNFLGLDSLAKHTLGLLAFSYGIVVDRKFEIYEMVDETSFFLAKEH